MAPTDETAFAFLLMKARPSGDLVLELEKRNPDGTGSGHRFFGPPALRSEATVLAEDALTERDVDAIAAMLGFAPLREFVMSVANGSFHPEGEDGLWTCDLCGGVFGQHQEKCLTAQAIELLDGGVMPLALMRDAWEASERG